ncbi:MAG: TIGR03809 family protein [Pseudorhodoplanes sp.]
MSLPRPPSSPATGIARYTLRRGCALAESRLSYLAELFESGRWRRFHSEIDFLSNVQEAKEAVERWRAMLADDAAVPARMPWQLLPPAEPANPYQGSVIHEAPRPPLHVVPTAADPAPRPTAVSRNAPQPKPGPAEPEPHWQRTLDPQAIAERYPMLRAAM